MLADDILGRQRELSEDPLPKSYIQAFREIDADPSNELIVAELDGDVIGTMQLTLTPSISFRGGKRCTVESVRVDEKHRGKGIGREMMLWAIDRAREKGCVSMQLTTHKDRRRPPLLRIARVFEIPHWDETEAVTTTARSSTFRWPAWPRNASTPHEAS
jgi:GNAT superfamily N-acetyltransferase